MKLIQLTIYLLLFHFSSAQDATWHKVEIEEGDGIYSLLRRYELLDASCNLDQFVMINKLKTRNDYLLNESYLLPVYIYNYDGKSIRSTIGNDDWDTAVAIQKYNEKILEKGLRKTHYTSSHLLWVPYHLVQCTKLDAPDHSSITTILDNSFKKEEILRNFPIFGKEYEETEILNSNLAGKVFYIVSGHGGPDPGAMVQTNGKTLCEDEYAYDVALRLCRSLLQNGATAHVIVRDPNDGIRDVAYLKCDRDETTHEKKQIPLNQVTRLRQRVHDINNLYYEYKKKGIKNQYCIVLHVDSRHQDRRTDLYFYHHKNSKVSRKLSKSIYEVFEEKYSQYRSNGQYHGSISSRNLHMIRETIPATIYIEMGNLRNSQDQKRFIIPSNRQALADWMTEGILNY